jgi:hypothetical protein
MSDTGGDVQDQVLQAVKKNQAAVVEAVRRWAESVEKIVPDVPTPSLPESLPNPSELIDQAFAFASNMLDAQREFTQQLLSAAPSLSRRTPEETGGESKPTAKKAGS